MSENTATPAKESAVLQNKKRLALEISELEADLAYCDTRLAMVSSEPETSYQKAQLKAFKLLEKQLKQRVMQIKRGAAINL